MLRTKGIGFVTSFVKGMFVCYIKNRMYEKVCIVIYLYVFGVVCVCSNEFSRIEFGKSIGESEGGGEDGVC